MMVHSRSIVVLAHVVYSDNYDFIKRRMPDVTFKFPGTVYQDKRRNHGNSRHCNRKWLEEFDCLSYSVEEDGVYCLSCRLFPVERQWAKANLLITNVM